MVKALPFTGHQIFAAFFKNNPPDVNWVHAAITRYGIDKIQCIDYEDKIFWCVPLPSDE